MWNSGTPALTSRGFVEEDFVKVAEFFDAAVKLAVKIKGQSKGSYFLDLHYASWVCVCFFIWKWLINYFNFFLLACWVLTKLICGWCWNFLIRNKAEGLLGRNSIIFYLSIGDSKAPPWCWGLCKTISNHWFWESYHEVQELRKEIFPLGMCYYLLIFSLIYSFSFVPYLLLTRGS